MSDISLPHFAYTALNKVLWHSLQGNFYLNTQDINPHIVFEIYTFEITATFPRDQ